MRIIVARPAARSGGGRGRESVVGRDVDAAGCAMARARRPDFRSCSRRSRRGAHGGRSGRPSASPGRARFPPGRNEPRRCATRDSPATCVFRLGGCLDLPCLAVRGVRAASRGGRARPPGLREPYSTESGSRAWTGFSAIHSLAPRARIPRQRLNTSSKRQRVDSGESASLTHAHRMHKYANLIHQGDPGPRPNPIFSP